MGTQFPFEVDSGKIEEVEAGLEEEYPLGLLLCKALLTSKALSNSQPAYGNLWHNQHSFWVLYSIVLALVPKVEIASGKTGVGADGSTGEASNGGGLLSLHLKGQSDSILKQICSLGTTDR